MNKRRQLETRKKKNFCCAFILPMVGINHKNVPSNFINAYIGKTYNVFVVFDKTEDYDIIFYNFFEHIKKNPCYKGHIEEEDEMVIELAIHENYYNDFSLFIQGKYSEFSDVYKKIIVSYFGNKTIKDSYHVTEYNTIHPQEFKKKQIAERLYEPKDLKEGLANIKEVLEIPNLEQETFKTIQELEQLNNATDEKQYELKQ